MVTRQVPSGPDLSALKIDDRVRRKKSPLRRIAFYALFLLAMIAAVGIFMAFNERRPTVDVVLAQAPARQQATLLNASGYVTPRRRATIAAKITGQVTAVYAEEGMHVKAGQVLARPSHACLLPHKRR